MAKTYFQILKITKVYKCAYILILTNKNNSLHCELKALYPHSIQYKFLSYNIDITND